MFNFQQSLTLLWSRYFSSIGRSSRSEFWWGCLALLIGVNLWSLLLPYVMASFVSLGGMICLIALILFLIGAFFLIIRRLHDCNRSCVWSILLFIPVLGWIVLLFLILPQSYAYTNEHGLNPNSDPEGHFKYYRYRHIFYRHGPYMGQQYRDYSTYQGNGVFGDKDDSSNHGFDQDPFKSGNNPFKSGNNPFKDGFGPNPFQDGFGNSFQNDSQQNYNHRNGPHHKTKKEQNSEQNNKS